MSTAYSSSINSGFSITNASTIQLKKAERWHHHSALIY